MPSYGGIARFILIAQLWAATTKETRNRHDWCLHRSRNGLDCGACHHLTVFSEPGYYFYQILDI